MGDLGEFPPGAESTHVLKLLDAAARCSICYSIFDAPLSLRGCGHSFCAACIRQNLGFQEKTGDPQCPSCRAPCHAQDLQPNVCLRELAEKYSAARGEVIRLVVQENEQKESAAAAKAAEIQAAPVRKKARKEDPPLVNKHLDLAPRRSARRSATGRAKEAAKLAEKEKIVADDDDDSLPGPSTRSRAQGKAESPVAKKKLKKEEECIELLSDEEEEEERKELSEEEEEERSVDHDADFDLTKDDEDAEDEEDEEFSPSPPLKRQKQPPPTATTTGVSKPPTAAQGTPQGFVPCPICAKSVPSFYINSHVDSCLNSGGGIASGSGGFSSEEQDPLLINNDDSNRPSTSAVPPPPPPLPTVQVKSNLAPKPTLSKPTIVQGPYVPLAVPPVLVPSLASDKIIRAALKKYNLPSDGKKPEMFDRYSQFRTAVLTANDRQERTSYNKIAQKMAAQGRQRAAAALLGGGGGGGSGGGNSGKQSAGGGVFKQGNGTKYSKNNNNSSKKRVGDPTVLQGDSFEELIAVTKARDAARRAARAAAAAAAAAEEEQEIKEQEKESKEEEEQQQQEASLDDSKPTEKKEEEEQKPAAAPVDHLEPVLPDVTREEMIAEEVRQAHEVSLLDSDDDDNW